MAILKSEVESYISRKTNARERELREHVAEIVNERINPIIDSIIDHPILDQLDRHTKNFTDTLEKAMQVFKTDKWDYNDVIQRVNRHVLTFGASRKSVLRQTANGYIQNPASKAMDVESDFRGSQELMDAVTELQQECAPLYKKIKELNTLREELYNAIKMETSGKKAYNAMVALGVDMEDFEEEQKSKGNLPAVIKLSVDVCILNGGC